MSSHEQFGFTTANHPPFVTDTAPTSGVFRSAENEKHLQAEKEAILLESGALRSLLQRVQWLESELRYHRFARLESELVPEEELKRPPIISPDLLDPKNKYVEVEQKMLQHYSVQLEASYESVRSGIFLNPVLEKLDIHPAYTLLELPPPKDRSWSGLEAYAEEARRFVSLHLPEVFTYLRKLRARVEKLGYQLPAVYMLPQEERLSSAALLAVQARRYEEQVRRDEPQDEAYLEMLEHDRAQLIRESMHIRAAVIAYLEEVRAPILREREQAAEEAKARRAAGTGIDY